MAPIGIKDVARHASVSVGTVSNVLNRPSRVSEETVARVRQAIDTLGFVRNDAARQLRIGHSSTIGLVVLDIGNPFFADIARGAEDAADSAGLSVILGNSDENTVREGAYLDLFEEQRVRGVLISPIGDVTERLNRLRSNGTRTVLVDRSGAGTGVSSVSVDNVAGGYLAVRHLLDLGRRRIAYLGAQFEIRQVVDRLEGARRAIAEVPGAQLEVVRADGLTVVDGRKAGQAIARRATADRPDAVFTVNDLLAVGVLQAFVMTSDVRVPDEVALVGYDDIDFAAATVVPLTSVRQPSRMLGETAVSILLEELDDPELTPQNVVFSPELVVRASSVYPPPA
ncbi:LacI family DNA-binding transcriptional regulator [Microcella humidisoli]|uniref:LacI family transcriptional regulator n=1 Tax=Microcella humidisoli TaxID=2963406 RepID=A0ABY5FZR8_9MICO|nr:LacI family DNA-binding transcriptional regulator [Microcella humidisoli]UTT63619.1 LacI family transcriptional regulator [Microcella humidisoli]